MAEQEQTDVELRDIWNLLRAVEKKIDTHIVEETTYKPKMLELVTILERSKGVITFIRLLIYVGVPISALLAWAKDHIKF